MPRLRRTHPGRPGFTRRRRGRGWSYHDVQGERITDPAVRDRIDALVIPPAWRDVWITPFPNGHLQAVGTTCTTQPGRATGIGSSTGACCNWARPCSTLIFEYVAKSGVNRVERIDDPLLVDLVGELARRRGVTPEEW